MKIFYHTLLLVLFAVISLFPQAGSYYNTINPSLSSFITDLESRIRAPYTKISYDQFDETNVTNFASRDTTNSQRVVTCVYSGENYVYTPPFAWGTYSREHTWCQSWMPSHGSTTSNEGSDQHHIFPVNQNKANGIRSNHPLGNVVTPSYTYLEGKLGKDSRDSVVWEPRAIHKGDAARALLYMSLRYDGINGYRWTFNYLKHTTDSLNEANQDLATLLAWHKADPPDKWEIDRNNYVQSIQQNRNPFVDHPEYVNYINFNDLSKLSPTYAAEPTNYASSFSASGSSNQINLSWTDADAGAQAPSGYLLMAYDNNNYFLPIDGETYADDIDLSDGRAIINIPYADPDAYTFTGLTANKHYYFTLISYNGTGTSRNYKIDGTLPQTNALYNASVITEPLTQASNLSFTSTTSSSLSFNWTNGSGSSRIILAHQGSPVDAVPLDNTLYTSSTVFGSGAQIGTGNYVVGKTTGSSLTVTGLLQNTSYYFKVFEFNGSDGTENYLSTNPASGNTTTISVSAPIVQASNLSCTSINPREVNLAWTNGSGSSRIVLCRTGASVNANPVNGVTYAADPAYRGGDTIGTNNLVVYNGPANNVTVTNLYPDSTYYFAVYELDGTGVSTAYLTASPAVANVTVPNYIMISEVYGGGGNSGATLKNDYIVLYNPTSSSVDLTGWSVQYTSSNGTFSNQLTKLAGSIGANSYYLIQEAAGAGGSVSLVNPNATGTIAMSGTAGQVALSQGINPVSGLLDQSLVDFVGYGSANKFEGSGPTTAPSNTNSVQRKINGIQDLNNNSTDFVAKAADVLPLPVELQSFSAEVRENKILLFWRTASEKNTFQFEIQRRREDNSSAWESIAAIQAHGNSNSPYDYSFADAPAGLGSYSYRLKMIDLDGSFEFSSVVNALLEAPVKFELSQNYPNPFNPETIISYSLPYSSIIKIEVYDGLGRLISELENGLRQAGYHEVTFKAGSLSSGIYFYTLTAESTEGNKIFRSVKKLMLMK